jgi:hypothetical protein
MSEPLRCAYCTTLILPGRVRRRLGDRVWHSGCWFEAERAQPTGEMPVIEYTEVER